MLTTQSLVQNALILLLNRCALSLTKGLRLEDAVNSTLEALVLACRLVPVSVELTPQEVDW